MLTQKHRVNLWSCPTGVDKTNYKKLKVNDLVLCAEGYYTQTLFVGKIIKKFRNSVDVLNYRDRTYWMVPVSNIIKEIKPNKYPEYFI